MSKLLKLKKWVTLEEAARHLSRMIDGEVVTVADVLRLALDDKIRLSVHLLNPVLVRAGKLRGRLDGGYRELSENEASRTSGAIKFDAGGGWVVPNGPYVGWDKVLVLEPRWCSINGGVLDLPMLGSTRRAIEREYQRLVGGAVDMNVGTGTGAGFIFEDGDKYYQFQEQFEENPSGPGSMAQLDEIKAAIGDGRLTGRKAEERLEQHAKDRTDFGSVILAWAWDERLLASERLPPNSNIVVRTANLLQLEADLDAIQGVGERNSIDPLGAPLITTNASMSEPNDRQSLLRIVAALLDLMLEKSPAGRPRAGYEGQAQIIEAIDQRSKGVRGLKPTNIEKKFAEANRELTQAKRDSEGGYEQTH